MSVAAMNRPKAKPVNVATVTARLNAMAKTERDKIMAPVCAQPHRRGFAQPDRRELESPLGRLCYSSWPNDATHADMCYAAGLDYAASILKANAARGFFGEGMTTDDSRRDCGAPTQEEIDEARRKRDALDRAVQRANEELVGVDSMLPKEMGRLCCTLDEPRADWVGKLQQGLFRLAMHYGHWDAGINWSKKYT